MDKMSNTNFPPEPIARLNQMPDTDIAWFNAGKHPAQGIIANSSSTEQALAGGASHTTSSLSKAGTATDVAISVAQDDTGNAIQKSYRHIKHALGTSARHVGKALHPQPLSLARFRLLSHTFRRPPRLPVGRPHRPPG